MIDMRTALLRVVLVFLFSGVIFFKFSDAGWALSREILRLNIDSECDVYRNRVVLGFKDKIYAQIKRGNHRAVDDLIVSRVSAFSYGNGDYVHGFYFFDILNEFSRAEISRQGFCGLSPREIRYGDVLFCYMTIRQRLDGGYISTADSGRIGENLYPVYIRTSSVYGKLERVWLAVKFIGRRDFVDSDGFSRRTSVFEEIHRYKINTDNISYYYVVPRGASVRSSSKVTVTNSTYNKATQGNVPSTSPGTRDGSKIKLGEKVFTSLCVICHGLFGTDIPHVALFDRYFIEKRDLVRILTNGTGNMPSFKRNLSSEEIRAVSAYLKGISDGGVGIATETGSKVFDANCKLCHGALGTQIPGVALFDKSFIGSRDIVGVVTNGNSGMPSFGGRLTRDEIKAVSLYLKTTAR